MFSQDDKVEMCKVRKMSRSWSDSHFSGVIPRMLRVRPWRASEVEEREKRETIIFLRFLLSTLLKTEIGRIPSADAGGDDCHRDPDNVWDRCM